LKYVYNLNTCLLDRAVVHNAYTIFNRIYFAFRKYYNLFVYLFVSWSGNIITPLLVYLIHFLCCFALSTDILYISDWPSSHPFFFIVSICIFVICNIGHLLQCHFTHIQLTFISWNTNQLSTCFHFSYMSLHFNRKIGTVVVVIVW
jgi:hypothetical protein